MTNAPPIPGRRRMLGALAGLPVALWATRAHALRTSSAGWMAAESGQPESAAILIAGPEGGTLDRWSRVLAPILSRALPLETALRRTPVGAPDGVTAANQFGARIVPDGQTLLLAPGDAALAWLVGDPRAQYDVARWVPVLSTLCSALVFVRAGVQVAQGRIRLASTGPVGVDLPAVLGIEMLGGRVDLLPALTEEAKLAAITQGSVEAVFLYGHKVDDQARSLLAAGARPLFALGTPDRTGSMVRSALFPDVPTFAELLAVNRGQRLRGPLFHAWCATAMAAQMEFALVLPELTPAAMVALWRRAGNEAVSTLDLQSIALANGLRTLSGSDASAAASVVAADQPALRALQSWLAERFNWRPA